MGRLLRRVTAIAAFGGLGGVTLLGCGAVSAPRVASTLPDSVSNSTPVVPSGVARAANSARTAGTASNASGARFGGSSRTSATAGATVPRSTTSTATIGGRPDSAAHAVSGTNVTQYAPAGVTTTTALNGGPTGTATPYPPLSRICVRRDFVYLTAQPSALRADGKSISILAARYNSRCQNVVGAMIVFSTEGSACGSLSASQATTHAGGEAKVTYVASSTVGSCVITASGGPGLDGQAVISQVAS